MNIEENLTMIESTPSLLTNPAAAVAMGAAVDAPRRRLPLRRVFRLTTRRRKVAILTILCFVTLC